MRPLRLRARWALPIDAPPIHDAAILIDAAGRIAAVGRHADVPAPDEALQRDLGTAVLVPGLVNTHTHLELTGFEGQAPEDDFRSWIQTIRRIKGSRTPDQYLESARRGVRDCWAGGVTTIADTGDSGAVVKALAELGGSGVAYQEVFGPDPGQLKESMQALATRVRELATFAGARVRLGVSPHAPYTVSGPLYSAVAAFARSNDLPVAVHVAESREESEFVTNQRGPFADAWRARGIQLLDHSSHQPPSRPPAQPTPIQWLAAHGVLGPRTLCIHAIQLTAADISTLAEHAASIAHCPLSNARHGHGVAPLGALRMAGIRIGLGTDSVASVGRLDLLGEARAARQIAGLTAAETLSLCTLDGARALGLEDEIGSLSAGKWGDLIAVDAANSPTGVEETPEEVVLAAGPESIRLTILGGRVVYQAGLPA